MHSGFGEDRYFAVDRRGERKLRYGEVFDRDYAVAVGEGGEESQGVVFNLLTCGIPFGGREVCRRVGEPQREVILDASVSSSAGGVDNGRREQSGWKSGGGDGLTVGVGTSQRVARLGGGGTHCFYKNGVVHSCGQDVCAEA